MTFHDAVRYFQGIGFKVEPGPRETEVTLIQSSEGATTTTVWPSSLLVPIAKISAERRVVNSLPERRV